MEPGAGSRGAFEVRAPGDRGTLVGTWPRCGPGEFEAAVAAARDLDPAWHRASPDDRRQILDRALAAIASDPDPTGCIAASTGLGEDGVRWHARVARPAGASSGAAPATPDEEPDAAGAGELSLVVPHWSELFRGVLDALLPDLRVGRAVVLFGDAHVPALADRVASALRDAGLPAGALTVVHDDARELLGAALASGAFGVVRASGLPTFERWLRAASVAPGRTRAGFGAGVFGATLRIAFTRLAKRRITIPAGRDPREAAEEVARAAFGPVEALGGQLQGQLGQVLCHPSAFARLTEALLERLESGSEYTDPPPLVEVDLERELARALDLGLDEGAAPIHRWPPPGSRSAGPGVNLGRLVFTNVDPSMRLSALRRPSPLLLLSRDEGALGQH